MSALECRLGRDPLFAPSRRTHPRIAEAHTARPFPAMNFEGLVYDGTMPESSCGLLSRRARPGMRFGTEFVRPCLGSQAESLGGHSKGPYALAARPRHETRLAVFPRLRAIRSAVKVHPIDRDREFSVWVVGFAHWPESLAGSLVPDLHLVIGLRERRGHTVLAFSGGTPHSRGPSAARSLARRAPATASRVPRHDG